MSVIQEPRVKKTIHGNSTPWFNWHSCHSAFASNSQSQHYDVLNAHCEYECKFRGKLYLSLQISRAEKKLLLQVIDGWIEQVTVWFQKWPTEYCLNLKQIFPSIARGTHGKRDKDRFSSSHRLLEERTVRDKYRFSGSIAALRLVSGRAMRFSTVTVVWHDVDALTEPGILDIIVPPGTLCYTENRWLVYHYGCYRLEEGICTI